ncbi:MAG: hypothetical protein J5723_01115, partial [Ruminococcus sp.]|nr:hypothetical protein [Ruminococcus sp.]
DLRKDLFLCPVVFESDKIDDNNIPLQLSAPDKELHFTLKAKEMAEAGSELHCVDELPDNMEPAKELQEGALHLRLLNAPDGSSFIPLFISYSVMTGIFGKNIHVGVISFDDAYELCRSDESIAGIVAAPGILDNLIMRTGIEEFYNSFNK